VRILPDKIQKYTFYAVYIWLQLCQILTKFNNFSTTKTDNKLYKLDTQLLSYYINNFLLMTTACRPWVWSLH